MDPSLGTSILGNDSLQGAGVVLLATAPPAADVLPRLEYERLFVEAGGILPGPCSSQAFAGIPSAASSSSSMAEGRKVRYLKDLSRQLTKQIEELVNSELHTLRQEIAEHQDPEGTQDRLGQTMDKARQVWHAIDEVSSVAASEYGPWRRKNVWGPKLTWIKEDLGRKIELEVIAEKYELYDAASEAVEFLDAETEWMKVIQKNEALADLINQTNINNENQADKLRAHMDALQLSLDAAVKKSTELNKASQEHDSLVQKHKLLEERLQVAANALDGVVSTQEAERSLRETLGFSALLAKLNEAHLRVQTLRTEFDAMQAANTMLSEKLNKEWVAFEAAQHRLCRTKALRKELASVLTAEVPLMEQVLEMRRQHNELHSEVAHCTYTCNIKDCAVEDVTLKLIWALQHSQLVIAQKSIRAGANVHAEWTEKRKTRKAGFLASRDIEEEVVHTAFSIIQKATRGFASLPALSDCLSEVAALADFVPELKASVQAERSLHSALQSNDLSAMQAALARYQSVPHTDQILVKKVADAIAAKLAAADRQTRHRERRNCFKNCCKHIFSVKPIIVILLDIACCCSTVLHIILFSHRLTSIGREESWHFSEKWMLGLPVTSVDGQWFLASALSLFSLSVFLLLLACRYDLGAALRLMIWSLFLLAVGVAVLELFCLRIPGLPEAPWRLYEILEILRSFVFLGCCCLGALLRILIYRKFQQEVAYYGKHDTEQLYMFVGGTFCSGVIVLLLWLLAMSWSVIIVVALYIMVFLLIIFCACFWSS